MTGRMDPKMGSGGSPARSMRSMTMPAPSAELLRQAESDAPAARFTQIVGAAALAKPTQQAPNDLRRRLGQLKRRRMRGSDDQTRRFFGRKVSVSERKAKTFRIRRGLACTNALPPTVSLDFHASQSLLPAGSVHRLAEAFTGLMDWYVTIDGARPFLALGWLRPLAVRSEAAIVVVERVPLCRRRSTSSPPAYEPR